MAGRRRSGRMRATTTATTSSRMTTRTSALRLDGDGAEKLLVLRRELGGKAAALRTGEEDARVGAALQDLLHCVARRIGRGERCLDRLHEALQQGVDVPFLRHR